MNIIIAIKLSGIVVVLKVFFRLSRKEEIFSSSSSRRNEVYTLQRFESRIKT